MELSAPRPSIQPAGRSRVCNVALVTAKELLSVCDSLSPPGTKIFWRGQGSVDWKLQPQAFRNGGLCLPFLDTMPLAAFPRFDAENEPPARWVEQVCAEAELLKVFLQRCQQQCLATPYEDVKSALQLVEPYAEAGSKTKISDWPPPELVPALALGQHFGLPTRLLDWTTNPLVACFFAAETCILDRTECMAVWAYKPSCAHQRVNQVKYTFERDRYLDKLAHVDERIDACNENQKAQFGVLMVPRPNRAPQDLFSEFSIEQEVSQHLDARRRPTTAPFLKLSLYRTQAWVLLHELDKLGINGSTLFPGYYSAARQAVLERKAWYFGDPIRSMAQEQMFTNITPTLLQRLQPLVTTIYSGVRFEPEEADTADQGA